MRKLPVHKPGLRPLTAVLAAAGLLCASVAGAQNLSADILVVGAGGAGMAAAIEAHEASNPKGRETSTQFIRKECSFPQKPREIGAKFYSFNGCMFYNIYTH